MWVLSHDKIYDSFLLHASNEKKKRTNRTYIYGYVFGSNYMIKRIMDKKK